MEKGGAAVKHLVMRVSVGVENDTFVKRLEEGTPVGGGGGCLWYGGKFLWYRGGCLWYGEYHPAVD